MQHTKPTLPPRAHHSPPTSCGGTEALQFLAFSKEAAVQVLRSRRLSRLGFGNNQEERRVMLNTVSNERLMEDNRSHLAWLMLQ